MTTVTFTWDGLNAAAVAKRVGAGVANVWLYAETESTLDVAHRLAEQGVPAGSLVVADAQRAGRGRMGRSWSSEPGRGVWSTLVERPADARALDVLSLRVGLQVAEALDALAGEAVSVKWPNDLLLGGGKLGGVLVEARWAGASLAWVAVGIGVNVVPPTGVDGAAGLPDGASRVDALVAIVRAARAAAAATGPLTPDEMRRYAARDALAGRRIASPALGQVAGVDASGALLVETERGIEHIRSGTIRLAEDT